MKKFLIAAAAAAMFVTTSVNAENVNNNQNNATVMDVVAELNQDDAIKFIPMYQKLLSEIESISKSEKMDDSKKSAKIDNLKKEYTLKFSEVLLTEQNDVAINTIPFEYINNRVTK
jgi:uncharacterized protein (DUF2344 family)